MEILEAIVKIKWRDTSEPPETDGDYYAILKSGKHRIVRYYQNGAWGGYNWMGDTGSSSDCINPNEIQCWTELLKK